MEDKSKCFSRIYDVLAQTISVLDVTTDIIVCYQFYAQDRMIFFAISLSILLLALIAYDALFVHIFSNEFQFCREVALFMVLLPVSPLIPFVFYYSDQPDSCLPKFLQQCCCFTLYFSQTDSTESASKFKQFFQSKIVRHAGFIVESLVEAFPQAILQMSAIVIYNETNITAIVSIFSLLSVASKSFVFSLGTSCNFKQLFFNWLCAVTDFFGTFFIVSWVFFKPHDEHLQDAFIMIQQVWLYKLYIFEFPMVLVCCLVSYCAYIWAICTEEWEDDRGCKAYTKTICYGFFGFIMFTFLLLCAIIAGLLVTEIMNWTWIALSFVVLGTSRFPSWHKLSLEFWFTILNWIKSAKKHHIGAKYAGYTSYTAKQDKIMRISAVNWVVSKEQKEVHDEILVEYLQKHQTESQYMNVTMRGLRNNNKTSRWKCDKDNAFWKWYGELWREIAADYKEYRNRWRQNRTCNSWNESCFHCTLALAIGSVTFVFGPLYFIGRFVHLSFAAFIVLYLYFGYSVNIWNTMEIDIFQIVMINVYIILCIMLSILFYFNAKEQYIMCHLLPSKEHLGEKFNHTLAVEATIKNITNHYYGMTFIPIRRAMVIDHFGPDIGPIIVSYLPNDDDFNLSEKIVRATVV